MRTAALFVTEVTEVGLVEIVEEAWVQSINRHTSTHNNQLLADDSSTTMSRPNGEGKCCCLDVSISTHASSVNDTGDNVQEVAIESQCDEEDRQHEWCHWIGGACEDSLTTSNVILPGRACDNNLVLGRVDSNRR